MKHFFLILFALVVLINRLKDQFVDKLYFASTSFFTLDNLFHYYNKCEDLMHLLYYYLFVIPP